MPQDKAGSDAKPPATSPGLDASSRTMRPIFATITIPCGVTIRCGKADVSVGAIGGGRGNYRRLFPQGYIREMWLGPVFVKYVSWR